MSLGNCALCGKYEPMTFEHVPPRCAFNDKIIFIQGYEQLLEKESLLFGKKSRSNRGFGKFALCASCNNNTGNWYAKDFCDFTKQGQKFLTDGAELPIVRGKYVIRPLNVIKQIILMFLVADSAGNLRKNKGIVEYVMHKQNRDFPEKLNIYIYSNSCSHKRMHGLGFGMDMGTGEKFQWSEINFNPFGYFLTYDSLPPNEYMVNINGFNDKEFNGMYNVDLITAYLKVSNSAIGSYDNVPNNNQGSLEQLYY